MQNNVITNPPAIVRSVTDLASLFAEAASAQRARQEFGRKRLHAARASGDALIRAKDLCPRREWLATLKKFWPYSERLAQDNMAIAAKWDLIQAFARPKSADSADLGITGALELIRGRRGAAPDVPAALASYAEQGLLDDEALALLRGLEQDYGPEVLSPIDFAGAIIGEVLGTPVNVRDNWGLLNAIRPLDQPALWPLIVDKLDTQAQKAVAAGIQTFLEDARARGGRIPHWEVTAFWFASTMIHLVDRFPDLAGRFTAILCQHLGVWRESFRAALVAVLLEGREGMEGRVWWGYLSDLRHAGVPAKLNGPGADLQAYPALLDSIESGLTDLERDGSVPLPSCMHGRLRREEESVEVVCGPNPELAGLPVA